MILPGLTDPTLAMLALVFVVILSGAMVHGTLGLGFAMVTTPLLTLFTDVRSAMLMILVPTLAITLISLLKGGNWRLSIGRYWPLAIYGAVGSLIGTRLIIVSDPGPYKLLLAGMMILYLNQNRIGLRMGWVRRRKSLAMAVFGLAAGILGGTVNVMVPVLIVFALEMRIAPVVTVQVFNFCFLLGKFAQAVVFAQAGLLTAPMLLHTLPLTALAVTILVAGMWLRRQVDTEVYRKWLRWVLSVIALVLIGQYGLQAL
ncbi:MAG: sulfite exporter TauE/SafE family protein [Desulfobacterales bacterium]|nr:sulfite exporter TauE/SafE family protein [Desulfobacterales bacterium]